MANVGQAALVVVGTVVGAYFGGPAGAQLGFALGSLAGSALFPTQLPSGPKITDNRTTTATVGVPIPFVFGTADVAGTVIWLAPYVQHTDNQGGKGGPTQQTFSYTQSIAIGLCERIDDEADDGVGAIGGISRVWENGTIVYDIRPQLAANPDLGTIAETDLEYANRLTASAAYAETFTLYLGTETQTADPTMEAIEGFGNVPAFRGMAYIVFPNRNLTIAQGLRHPSFTFEVFQAGMGACEDSSPLSTHILYPWAGGTEANPTNLLNINTYRINYADNHLPDYGSIPWSTDYTTQDDALGILDGFYNVSLSYIGYAAGELPREVQQSGGTPVTDGLTGFNPATVWLHFNFRQPDHGFWSDQQRSASEITASYPAQTPNATYHQGQGGDSAGLVHITSTPFVPGPAPYPPWNIPYAYGVSRDPGLWEEYLDDGVITVTRTPGPPNDPCFGLPISAQNPGYSIMPDGRLVRCGPWTLITGGTHTYASLQSFRTDAVACRYPLNPTVRDDDPNYLSGTFWTAAYDAAVVKGTMPAGLVYPADYPVVASAVYSLDMQVCEAAGGDVAISEIISAVCKRAGLTIDQIDVSDLTATKIPGYSISSISDGAGVISPLRSVAFFDCVESAGVLKFPTRGKEVVATLTSDDIGCFDGGNTGGDPPAAVTTARSDETTLPRSIRYHYKAVSRDYQDAEADSPFRLAAKAVNDQDISVPMVLADEQAAQAAEIMWSDAWAGQNAHELSVDQAWFELEGGDCIGVPIDGVIQRLRITQDTNAAGVLRKLSCVRDNQGSYISFAVAAPVEHVPSQLKLLSASSAEYLDLPALQDADNDPGFYVAAQRKDGLGNDWKGATIYKSVDGGLTFAAVFSLTTEATIGALQSAVLPSQAYTWDDLTVITVTVASAAFTFESRTDDAVLAGANAAAMGANGRWEIVQFANATKIDDTHWQLSRLLRGRRGTEHVIGSSQAGDTFVMISTGDLSRLVLQQSEIGANRVYKVVSIGASFSSGINTTFAGHAQALVPFSPVDLAAHRQTDDDILISWHRRGRLGRTLMSGIDVPLSEATEAYQVDILDDSGSPEVVKRTLSVTSQDAVYTAAQQIADFGSGPTLTHIKVAIYQMSAVVGRGTPAIEVLTIG